MAAITPVPPSGTQLIQVLDGEPVPRHRLTEPWVGWFRNLFNLLKPGLTKQVVVGGTTLTFVNGIFTGSSP